MKTLTASDLNLEFGLKCIDVFNEAVKDFQRLVKTKKQRDLFFKVIFGENIYKHLSDQYQAKDDFARFYLNLDLNCSRNLIIHLDRFNDINPEFPEFSDWEQLADQYKLQGPARNISTVRKIALTMGHKTKWDVWPHGMVWIYKFVLYANNNGIEGSVFDKATSDHIDNYTGNRYGNWQNWATLWEHSPAFAKEAILKQLINY